MSVQKLMTRPKESITLTCTPEVRLRLEQIALEHGCLWGSKPNISRLLEYIANGEILLEPPIKNRLAQIRIAKLEAEIAKLKLTSG